MKATITYLIDTPTDFNVILHKAGRMPTPKVVIPFLGEHRGDGIPHPEFPWLRATTIKSVKRKKYVGFTTVEDKLELVVEFEGEDQGDAG